ncbi:MAG: hypothetical protein AAGI23_21635 [Bacteroidota bacterium]
MKTVFSLLLLAMSICLFTACEDDNETQLSNTLNYDGAPFSGPVLPFGEHTFAVRFGEEELADYVGQFLEEITFYAGEEPETVEVLVYGEGTATTPGAQLYSAKISGLSLPDWNDHSIATPIEITGDDLWLAVKVLHTATQRSIGCDEGPNQQDGDWLFRADDPNWQSFSATTPESVNWNIRGKVSE